jgi:hypothetical protein
MAMPIHSLDIRPLPPPRPIKQRASQLWRETRFSTPHELLLPFTPRQRIILDRILHDSIIRPDLRVRVVPAPETKIGHEPCGFFAGCSREGPDRVVGCVGDVGEFVLDAENEFDVDTGSGSLVAVGIRDESAMHSRQRSKYLPPMIFPPRTRRKHIQLPIRDPRARHTSVQRNGIQLRTRDPAPSRPVRIRAMYILQQPRKRSIALLPSERRIMSVARILEFPPLQLR